MSGQKRRPDFSSHEMKKYQFAVSSEGGKGAVHFCPVCHMLLHITSFGANCASCQYRMDFADLGTSTEEVMTKVNIEKDDLFSIVEDSLAAQATVDEECPKCSHGVASFVTMQMRSVDEGQTVFYTCVKCGFRWSVNN